MRSTTVKERPILMSGPMVRAVRDGMKTQTRRVAEVIGGGLVLDRGPRFVTTASLVGDSILWRPTGESDYVPVPADMIQRGCPYGQPGDRLWVRETWRTDRSTKAVIYRADVRDREPSETREEPGVTWRPGIYMRRHACRFLLEIVGVRAERLHRITEEDAKAEGVKIHVSTEGCPSGMARAGYFQIPTPYQPLEPGHEYRAAYSILWDKLNKSRGFGWSTNPWVWVIEFRGVKP